MANGDDDYTPPGERSYSEREEQRVESIQDEEERRQEAQESEAVTVDEQGDVEARDLDRQGVKTDTDLDGQAEESPGVAVGGLPGEFESGKVEQIRNEVLAEQKQEQLQRKRENIRSSSTDRFGTGGGDTISRDEAISQVEEQIEQAERAEEQAVQNQEIISQNQTLQEQIDRRERQQELQEGFEGLRDYVDENVSGRDRREIEDDGFLTGFSEGGTQDRNIVQRFADQAQETGFELVQAGEGIGDATAEMAQSNPLTSDVGEGFAAGLESSFGFGETIQTIAESDLSEPVESGERIVDTAVGEVLNPLAVQTPLDELGIVEESESLEERTQQVQSAAVGTPADTAGFFTTVGGGLLDISEEQGARFVSSTGELVTGERVGRDRREGEGLERITEGSLIVGSAIAENPEQEVTEEITQEATEAVLGFGVVTPTITTTPSASSVTDTVRSGASKVRELGESAAESISDPNALGAGAGALLPEPDTTTPTETRETVSVDQDALDAFEVDPLSPGTGDAASLDSRFDSVSGSGARSGLTDLIGVTSVSGDRAVSEPASIADSRPESESIAESDIMSIDESLTETEAVTLTETVTETPTLSLTETLTETPTQTPTDTPSLSLTPTPDIESGTDDELQQGVVQDDPLDSEFEFRPSVGAEILGITAEDVPDRSEIQDPLSLRPVVEDD